MIKTIILYFSAFFLLICESLTHAAPISANEFAMLQSKANAGDIKAETLVGMAYLLGHGTQQNVNQGLAHLSRTATAGDALAQFTLGTLYLIGSPELPQNDQQAFLWFEKAANQGDQDATYAVSRLYAQGRGVKQSDSKALQTLTKVTDPAQAEYILGTWYSSDKFLGDNAKKAFKYFEKSANKGNADAQHRLGHLYNDGKGVSQNPKKAQEWLVKAAAQGHKNAQKHLDSGTFED